MGFSVAHAVRAFRKPPTIPREPEQRHAVGRLLRTQQSHAQLREGIKRKTL